MGERESDPRARHFIRKRERTLNRSQVEQMDRDDEALAECGNALCPSWCALLQRCDVLLEQLQQQRARYLCPLPAATRHDERQSRAWIRDIRCIRGA